MEKCRKISKRLSAFLDNEVLEKERASIEHHLKQCPECKKQLALLAESWEFLRQWESSQVPANLASHFWLRVKEKSEKPGFKFTGLWEVARNYAVGLCILMVGIFMGAYVGNVMLQSATPEIYSAGNGNNLSEVAYLGGMPSESIEEAYINVFSIENGLNSAEI
jgi:anti-sigma factor RsiW